MWTGPGARSRRARCRRRSGARRGSPPATRPAPCRAPAGRAAARRRRSARRLHSAAAARRSPRRRVPRGAPSSASTAPSSNSAQNPARSRTTKASSSSISSSSGVRAPVHGRDARPAPRAAGHARNLAFTPGAAGRRVGAMTPYAQERAKDKITALAAAGLDLVPFWREAGEIIDAAGPALHGALLVHARPGVAADHEPLQRVHAGAPARVARARVLRGRRPQARRRGPLPDAGSRRCTRPTGGDPSWQPSVAGEHRARRRPGAHRRPAHPARRRLGRARPLPRAGRSRMFSDDEIAFVRAVAPALAEGARRALLLGEAQDPEGPDAPGLLVLSSAWEVESATPGVERWISDLPGRRLGRRAPAARRAGRGRAGAALRRGRDAPGEVALARVLSRLRHVGRAARRGARRRRRAARRGDRRSPRIRPASRRCSCRPTA